MTITIADGRGALWQWDTGRRLRVGSGVEQIHYQNRALGCSVDVDVGADGTAIIPDELLQDCHTLTAYVYVTDDTGAYTMEQQDFIVHKRAKPAGYVYTPTDQMTLQTIQSQIGDLADLTTEAKNNLVAAINEAAQSGGGGGSTVELDTTLSEAGKAADAKAVGDALTGKQDTISDLEAIRTGAAKGATALQSVPSTYRTASEQDTIDDGKVDKVTGKGLSSNDYTDAAKAKVDALAPVATSGSYNDLTNKPTIPTALPNPNALTFTGAVTGSYDGSAPMTVNIPSGGGGGETGAKEFRLVRSITLGEQSDRVDISVDSSGSAFALHEVYVMISAQSYDDAYHEVNFLPNGRWGSFDAYIASANKASKSSEAWKNNMIFMQCMRTALYAASSFRQRHKTMA